MSENKRHHQYPQSPLQTPPSRPPLPPLGFTKSLGDIFKTAKPLPRLSDAGMSLVALLIVSVVAMLVVPIGSGYRSLKQLWTNMRVTTTHQIQRKSQKNSKLKEAAISSYIELATSSFSAFITNCTHDTPKSTTRVQCMTLTTSQPIDTTNRIKYHDYSRTSTRTFCRYNRTSSIPREVLASVVDVFNSGSPYLVRLWERYSVM